MIIVIILNSIIIRTMIIILINTIVITVLLSMSPLVVACDFGLILGTPSTLDTLYTPPLTPTSISFFSDSSFSTWKLIRNSNISCFREISL